MPDRHDTPKDKSANSGSAADREPHPGIKDENIRREGEPRERESKSTAGMGNQQGGKARTR